MKRLATALLLLLSTTAWAAPGSMSLGDVMCRAKSAVGYSYWWGGSCWCASGCGGSFGACGAGVCTPKAGSTGCPSCTHSGNYGADCSGFLYTVWRIGGLSATDHCGPHGPKSTTYKSSTSNWTAVAPADRQKGDAIAKTGHVMLFESSTSWGDHWVYEAKGCKYGIVHNIRSATLGSTWKVSRRKNLIDAPSEPKLEVAITSPGVAGQTKDFRPEGTSKGVLDLYTGQTVDLEIVVSALADGSATSGPLTLSYAAESEWLQPVAYTIYTDWPAKDKATWKVNDSNSAPGNPPNASPPASGELNLYAFSPGETKKVVLTVKAAKYSIGATDHPHLSASIGGTTLKAAFEADVYSRRRWEFDSTQPETEGWTAGNAVDKLKVNTSASCLAAHQAGSDPQLISPKTSFDAAKYPGLKLRVRSHVGAVAGKVYWATADAGGFAEKRSAEFVSPGDGSFHDLTVSMAGEANWKGTITRLRIDPSETGSSWVDYASIKAVTSVSGTSGDADGDGWLAAPAGPDCNDGQAGAYPGAAELCDGLDNDCDAEADEGHDVGAPCTAGVGACASSGSIQCTTGGQAACSAVAGAPAAESCDGVDNDCDGLSDEDFGLGEACAIPGDGCSIPGVLVCDAAGQPICETPSGPIRERCNGLDDDCDGEADEGLLVGQGCSIGAGACQTDGVWVCDPAGETVCSAKLIAPEPERRDGLDNDCDGRTDEGFPVTAWLPDDDVAALSGLGSTPEEGGPGAAALLDDATPGALLPDGAAGCSTTGGPTGPAGLALLALMLLCLGRREGAEKPGG